MAHKRVAMVITIKAVAINMVQTERRVNTPRLTVSAPIMVIMVIIGLSNVCEGWLALSTKRFFYRGCPIDEMIYSFRTSVPNPTSPLTLAGPFAFSVDQRLATAVESI